MKPTPLLKNAFFVCLLALGTMLPHTSHSAESRAAGFDVREFVCPMGGAKFSQDVGYLSMSLIRFSDGSWLGDEHIDVQIPQCPGNGLLLIPDYDSESDSQKLSYRNYTPEQMVRLPTLIGSDDFRKLGEKSRHERAHWLATQLGMSANTRMELLIRASWSVTDSSERKRLVARIADEGPALVDAMAGSETAKWVRRLLIANALRELARFDDADALLGSIAASIPADADIKDPDNFNALLGNITKMGKVIALRDDDRFPVDLSYEKWVNQVCGGGTLPPPYGPRTDNAKAACERRKQQRQASENEFEEAMRLSKDPAELDRQCQATPEDKRQPGLAQACKSAQNNRDDKAGKLLVMHQARKVATDCEATPDNEQKGPLFYACIKYRSALEMALTILLIEDDDGYAIICNDGRMPPDRAFYASMACSSAERERGDREQEKLLANPAALDADCAQTPSKERSHELRMACTERSTRLWQAKAKHLAADPAAYKTACAAIDAKPKDYSLIREYDEQTALCSEAKRLVKWNADMAELAASADNQTKPAMPREPDMFEPDSELSKVALESAQRVVAKAKAERTYPKRKRGDIF